MRSVDVLGVVVLLGLWVLSGQSVLLYERSCRKVSGCWRRGGFLMALVCMGYLLLSGNVVSPVVGGASRVVGCL